MRGSICRWRSARGARTRRAAILVALLAATAACGPAPPSRPTGPIRPQRLSLTPRVVRDDQVHRAVVVPEFLRELPSDPGVWLRLAFRDQANPTGVLIEFLTSCPKIERRAVPCGGGRACVMSWHRGEEVLSGRAALSVGEHVYWWPGRVPYCAVVRYSLGPGPYAGALERFVLDFSSHASPARPRRPASAPTSAPAAAPASATPP